MIKKYWEKLKTLAKNSPVTFGVGLVIGYLLGSFFGEGISIF